VLEITVYDEDRDKKIDFLGKIAIPLLKVKCFIELVDNRITSNVKQIEHTFSHMKFLLLNR
jgi:hypothetical protein